MWDSLQSPFQSLCLVMPVTKRISRPSQRNFYCTVSLHRRRHSSWMLYKRCSELRRVKSVSAAGSGLAAVGFVRHDGRLSHTNTRHQLSLMWQSRACVIMSNQLAHMTAVWFCLLVNIGGSLPLNAPVYRPALSCCRRLDEPHASPCLFASVLMFAVFYTVCVFACSGKLTRAEKGSVSTGSSTKTHLQQKINK